MTSDLSEPQTAITWLCSAVPEWNPSHLAGRKELCRALAKEKFSQVGTVSTEHIVSGEGRFLRGMEEVSWVDWPTGPLLGDCFKLPGAGILETALLAVLACVAPSGAYLDRPLPLRCVGYAEPCPALHVPPRSAIAGLPHSPVTA